MLPRSLFLFGGKPCCPESPTLGAIEIQNLLMIDTWILARDVAKKNSEIICCPRIADLSGKYYAEMIPIRANAGKLLKVRSGARLIPARI